MDLTSTTEFVSQERKLRKVVASALVGNMLEFYDLIIYGFMAAHISALFFPTADKRVSLLLALATFGISYFIRPIGALVIGSYSDRKGRKAGMLLTIWSMGIGTALMAFAPTYGDWGIWGTVVLVLGKLLQGFSAGGEFGSSVSFVVEHSPPNRRSFYASFQVVGVGLAIALSSIVGYGVNHFLSEEAIRGWGWRLPFVLGLVIVPFGYWIRSRVDETPEFISAPSVDSPIKATFASSKGRIICAVGVYSLAASTNYLLGIYMPLYAQKNLGLSAADSMWGGLAFAIVQIFLPPITGKIADRIGSLRVISTGVVLTTVFTLPAFYAMIRYPQLPVYVLCIFAVTTFVVLFQGPMPAYLSSLFGHEVRTTGLALIHNLNFTVVGGFSLLICTWLIDVTQSKMIPAFYVLVTGMIALFCLAAFARSIKSSSGGREER